MTPEDKKRLQEIESTAWYAPRTRSSRDNLVWMVAKIRELDGHLHGKPVEESGFAGGGI